MSSSSLLRTGGLLLLIAGGGWFVWRTAAAPAPSPSLPVEQVFSTSVAPVIPSTTSTGPAVPPVSQPVPAPVSSTVATTTAALPKEWRLAVAFLPQAPHKNWDMPYQEACEEASMLMVQAYFASAPKTFTPDTGDAAILAFVEWQAKQFGAEVVDLTAAQVVEAIEGYMPELEAEVKPVRNAKDIQRELVAGNPVILPANGKTLANPRFRNGGPRYHMLVIKGYLADGRWITNDPGTQFGENFLYPQDNLVDSARDWNGGDVPNGEPVMIVVKKR